MRINFSKLVGSLLVWSATVAASPPAYAAIATNGLNLGAAQATTSTDRFIIKLREPSTRDIERRIQDIGRTSMGGVTYLRRMSGNSDVVKVPRKLQKVEAEEIARRLRAHPGVASAEPDYLMVHHVLPNDPMFAQQWHYYEPAGGINLPAAWDNSTGSSNIVVAVLDTGTRPHVDLGGRLLAGYDFIKDLPTSNDGDARDANSGDPGDYGCNGSNSSWHGTHVAGTIGAVSNNSSGLSGINWVSKILPIRVLGVCGGYTSDIVDGLRWAAGISVPNVPLNPTPARVANLSLGGDNGGCSTSFQNAVNDVTARGMAVVVSAGNSAIDAATFEPASCSGVITVAATGRNGNRASYTNTGSKVAIAAPGGSGSNGILSTLNAGLTAPGADSYAYYQGTSMAAPHVAGTVSLMLSKNPALTPAQVLQILKSTARQFPTGTGLDCSTTSCGAGIVDAAAAVVAAANFGLPPPPPPPTNLVNLALPANGGIATASSTHSSGFPVAAINNGNRRGNTWGNGGGWNDASADTYSDWAQIDFGSAKSVAEINVFTLQDNYANPQEPTEALIFTQYGITGFEVQYWDGLNWTTVPGGSVSGNNKVWRKFTFSPVTTSRIRVLVTNALAGYSRITEIEAFGTPSTVPPPGPAPTVNQASQSSGAVASATSTYSSNFAPAGANNADRRGLNWGAGGGWNDATPGQYPEALQILFNGVKTISEIDVFTVQDVYNAPSDPTPTMTFSLYGITDFDVQYWNGAAWITVPGGAVNGNNLVWRKFTFAPVTTDRIRVNVRNARDGYSRIVEVEAY
jgi:serine protease